MLPWPIEGEAHHPLWRLFPPSTTLRLLALLLPCSASLTWLIASACRSSFSRVLDTKPFAQHSESLPTVCLPNAALVTMTLTLGQVQLLYEGSIARAPWPGHQLRSHTQDIAAAKRPDIQGEAPPRDQGSNLRHCVTLQEVQSRLRARRHHPQLPHGRDPGYVLACRLPTPSLS